VVASPQAVSALEVDSGREVVVAREPEAFAREVVCLLADPPRRRQIGWAGRSFVERHHRWDTVVTQLERTYDELIGARS